MIALQSSGFWFTIWPFVAGVAAGVLVGVSSGIGLGYWLTHRWRRP